MGREGKVNFKRNLNKRVRSKENVSDDSDEDYVVESEENASDYDSEDSGKSLDGFASEESNDSFIEEEELEEEWEIRKVSRVKKKSGHVKNGKINGKTTQKRKKPSYESEDEDYAEDEDYVDDDDDDDDDDNEEFTPDEDEDFLYDDEESTVKKKNSDVMVSKKKKSTRKKGSRRSRKRTRKSNVLPKPATKNRTKVCRLKKKERIECENKDDGYFIDNDLVVGEKSNKNSSSRRKKYAIYSESDCASSGSSDYEYAISEEQREQVKEASKLYGDSKTNLWSSGSVKKIEENGDSCHQTKPSVKKGKEKVKEVKPEVGKQVCGVCLSEEDKRRFRGALDCCSHYFCYTCIIEWSKVESRCPLCKQRFTTITKNGRSTTEMDLKNMVIQVPKRDQVYQPSEEEIRSFIDPYENVICTECHEGGDDGLMLLCDLCDSPAHTYCVGLGQQVPEGNWYCGGCRPVALGSSSSQAQDIWSHQRTTGNVFNRSVPSINLEEAPDTILESSPYLVLAQGLGMSSPRLSTVQTSSSTGAGALTLSVRRQLLRCIQNLRANRMNVMGVGTDFTPASNVPFEFPNSQIDQGSTAEIQVPMTRDMGLLQHSFLGNRLQNDDHPSSSIQNRDISSLSLSLLRRQMIQNLPVMTTDQPTNSTLWPGLTGVDSVPGYEQFNQNINGRSTFRSDGYLPPYINREQSQFYVVKEQLQSIVKRHLEGLSQDFELGNVAFKDIARRSTHTILAACGLDHKRDAVAFVPQKSCCNHVDRLLNGQTSIMKGLCPSCFDSMVRDVVKRIVEMRDSKWLSLGL